MFLQTEGGGHIGFGANPVDVHILVASFTYSLLNQWVDFDQTCIDTL